MIRAASPGRGPLTAGDLLASPRGSALCLELLQRAAPAASRELTAAASRDGVGGTSDEVRSAVALVVRDVGSWEDPLEFADVMDVVVSGSMGWQPPWDEDLVARLPLVHAVLQPIAEAVLAAPAAAWWGNPVDLTRLRVAYRHDEDEKPPVLRTSGAAGVLQAWREEVVTREQEAARQRDADPAAEWSGRWWSHPEYELPTTTRPVGTAGAAKLLWEEDSFGQWSARVWPVKPTRPVRVLEVHGPGAWIELVDRYPLEVTATRRDVWRWVTGVDRRWFIPDWAAVAEEWDGVHVSVDGWLTTAVRLLELDRTRAAVLAGWDPDQTWWLTDCLQNDGDPVDWFNDQRLAGTGFNWQPIASPGQEGSDGGDVG